MAGKPVAPRKVIEMMKEATGASDDEVCLMLQLCDGDPNKATEALLSSGWGLGWGCLLGMLLVLPSPCSRHLLTVTFVSVLQIPSSRWRARRTRGPR